LSYHSTTQSPEAGHKFNFLTFPDLLERAGFYLRGKRADCPFCLADGTRHGRSTVSFNDEVAFCHRCKWTANARILSRSLGVHVAPERPEQRDRRERAKRFSEWLNACHLTLMERLTYLREQAEIAKRVLTLDPDDESAWTKLADFYHNQAAILGALDILVFEKLSPWLDQPMTREKLEGAFAEAAYVR